MHWLCPKCRAGFDERRERCPADSTRLIENLSGRMFGGRWSVERLLGVGGGGATVWGAMGLETRRPVALKLAPATDVAEVRRFERGARISGMLDHPHITRVIEHGRDGEHAILVMELLEGETLRKRIARQRVVSPAEAAHIADQVLDALDYAHFHGIVHRDIKLSNLFVTPTNDDRLFVKVLDWGIAKFVNGTEPQGLEPAETSPEDGLAVTQAQQILGTPEYMAPEQIVGGAADVRSDIYAVGIVLYRLLAGRHPFEAKTRAEMYHSHLMKEVPPIPGITSALDAVVRRALAKRPEDRWASAGAMRRALLAVMHAPAPELESTSGFIARTADPDNTTTERAPTGASLRPVKATSRRRGLVIGGLAAAAAVATLAVLALPGSQGTTKDQAPAASAAPETHATEKVAVAPAPERPATQPARVETSSAPAAPSPADTALAATASPPTAAPVTEAVAQAPRQQAPAAPADQPKVAEKAPAPTTPTQTARETRPTHPSVSTSAPAASPIVEMPQPAPIPVSSAPAPQVVAPPTAPPVVAAPAPTLDQGAARIAAVTTPAPAPAPTPSLVPSPKPEVADVEPVAPREVPKPPSSGNEVIPFGAGMSRPVRIAGVEPKYTREALAVGVEGVVIARCVIELDGSLSGCKVLKSLEHMDQAVLGALATYRFRPITFEGRPRRVSYVFNFNFVDRR